MRFKDRLFPNRKVPKRVDRIRAPSFPFLPAPRPFGSSGAGRRLQDLFAESRADILALCREVVAARPYLAEIELRGESEKLPHWKNGYMPPLDGMILYTLLRLRRPKTYLEIGSGNSTKFARKAIQDHGLPTRIISIDPVPRAEIDTLCDEVIRKPFQDIGEEALGWLQEGDVLFQDGSHHSFTNNDTTVFFTEFLPLLPRGVAWGIHDIFLPEDYPAKWYKRFYNEQYMLVTYILAGAAGDRMLFPAGYVQRDDEMNRVLDGVFDLPALAGQRDRRSSSFWMARSKIAQ